MDSMCEVRPGHPDLSPLTGNIVFCFNLITFLWYYFDIFTHKYNIYIHILLWYCYFHWSKWSSFTTGQQFRLGLLQLHKTVMITHRHSKQQSQHLSDKQASKNFFWSNLRHKPVSLLLKCVPVGSHDAMSYCLDINSPLVRAESDFFRLLDGVFSCFTRPAIFRWATTQVGTENTTTALSLCRQRCEDNWEVSAMGAETRRSQV